MDKIFPKHSDFGDNWENELFSEHSNKLVYDRPSYHGAPQHLIGLRAHWIIIKGLTKLGYYHICVRSCPTTIDVSLLDAKISWKSIKPLW